MRSDENPRTDLADLLGDLFTRFGVQPFFSLSVSISDKDSSLHILKIDEPKLILSARNYYSESERGKEGYLRLYTLLTVHVFRSYEEGDLSHLRLVRRNVQI